MDTHFEALLCWVENTLSDALFTGAIFTDPEESLTAISFSTKGGKGRHRVLQVNGFCILYRWKWCNNIFSCRYVGLVRAERNTNPLYPFVKGNTCPFGKGVRGFKQDFRLTISVDSLKELISNSVITKLEEYRMELLKERNRQSEIKKKYGIKSLEYFIVKLDGDLITLLMRKDAGENVDLAIRNKEERKTEYERALKDLEIQIEKEKSLTITMPRFVGIIGVVPPTKIDRAMQSNTEVEKIGMEIARQFELNNGRLPEDVSEQNLGFDIRSTDKNGQARYIEVKARAGTGDVALTQNEWFKAQRFRDDYYLYVVYNAANRPELFIIQNPADTVKPEEKVEIVRYIVNSDEIKRKGRSS